MTNGSPTPNTPNNTPRTRKANAKARASKGLAFALGAAVAVVALGLSAQSCGRPGTPAQDSEGNAIVLPWLAWEVYVIAAAIAGYIIVNQSTGEERRFNSRSEADDYIRSRGGTVVMQHQSQGSNPNAMARPSSGSSAIPATIGNQCRDQRRPPRESCDESICYVSPSDGNAAAARRIHSHKNKKGDDSCFVYSWGGAPFGLDPAHDWVKHYHLYELDSSGRCRTNAHFYILSAADFASYKGKCKKY